MQALLASLVISMGVQDAAFKAGMANARAEARKTDQDFDRSTKSMESSFDRAAHQINAAAMRVIDGVKHMRDEVTSAGLKMTAGLTLPLGALGATSASTAADFQTAMNKVHAAMLDATPEQLNKLREAALKLGPEMGRSAIKAAGAIESLAKNGMSAAAILDGGLVSALKLGALGETELGNAADATTDIMQQFHLAATDLPGVVDKVSGALDASKLSFDGYKDAIGQVGGIAGGLGYQFEDMNAALAAVIPLMTGGSDAGTSFKTFLLSLVPQSKEAAGIMEQLGISFFDAEGNAKSLSEVAEILNTRLAGLSQAKRQKALTEMFGTDGMRVAIALMQAGSKGIADIKAQIDKASADQKLSVLLDGEAAATQRLASAWEKLKIAIGEAGLIQVLTWVKDGVASVVETVASAPPAFFYLVTAAGLVAASLGPIVLIGTKLIPLFVLMALRSTALVGTFSVLGLGMSALLNPAGFLIGLLGRLALAAGANTALGALGATLLKVAGPVGILVTALTILVPLMMRHAQASKQYQDALTKASTETANASDIVMKLAFAQGKAREEALALARADRVRAVAAVAAARADLTAARAASMRARTVATAQGSTMLGKVNNTLSAPFIGAQRTIAGWFGIKDKTDRVQAATNQQAAAQVLGETLKRFDILDSAIKGAEGSIGKPLDNSAFADDEKKAKKVRTPKGRDTSADAEDYAAKLADVRQSQLQAQADLTGSYRARYVADMAALDADRAAFARQLATDDRLTDAKRASLLAEKDKEIATRRGIVEQARSTAEAQESYDLAVAVNDAQQELVRSQNDLADSVGARRDGEMRLLDLQRQREEADLDLILATKATASAEWSNAMKRKEQLDGIYGARAAAIGRQNEGPAAAYMRTLNRSGGAMLEDAQNGAVDALRGLNSEITDAIMGTGKLGDAFANMGKRIMATLIDIAVQQRLIRPLAEKLLGTGGGGGSLSSLASLFGIRSDASAFGAQVASSANASLDALPSGMPSFGGYRAAGGPIEPNKWYMVGENGPEPFFSGVGGHMLPNSSLSSTGRRSSEPMRLVVEEAPGFASRVVGLSDGVVMERVSANNRTGALRQRQQLGSGGR